MLCLAGTAQAARTPAPQQRAVASKVYARAKGHRIIIVNDGRHSHRLDLSDKLGAAHIEGVSVALLTRKSGFTYLVLDVCGASKWPQDERHCGLGAECNLVWLKLDRRWRVLESKSALYTSCWYVKTNDSPVRVEGRRLSVEYDNFHDETRGQVTYDADRPEKGLVIVEKPFTKDAP